jgi:hypothetical protein
LETIIELAGPKGRMSLVSETSYNEEMKKYTIRGKRIS